MPQVVRDGDKEKVIEGLEDTTDNTEAPPPDYYDAEGQGIYETEPTITVQKVELAEAKGSETVFCNGKGVVLAGSSFSDRVITKYDRTFKIDSDGKLTGKYTDSEVSKEITSIDTREGSPTVFAEGYPIVRKGDELSDGEIGEASEDVFAN